MGIFGYFRLSKRICGAKGFVFCVSFLAEGEGEEGYFRLSKGICGTKDFVFPFLSG